MEFSGTYTALVTPFHDDAEQSIDFAALERLIESQIEGGVRGLVPCGTTGETPTLTDEEDLAVIERAVKLARKQTGKAGRVQVVAGTGSNSTKSAIKASKDAEKMGVDAIMIVTPYYNKPTQQGLFSHYCAIAKSVSLPVVVYNIPGRSGIDLLPETLKQIAEACPNVVATKEATGNVLRAQTIVQSMGSKMTVLSGDDALTLPMIACGAKGVISVTSNVYPKEVSRATTLALEGRFAEARELHLRLLPVHEAMFVEANPSPAKAALVHKKMMLDVVRPPLVPASTSAREKIVRAMETFEKGQHA
jgi:4-hydroxy-tetrahydrodipicolinate synthase